jgi:hypothetical protein
MTRWDGKLMIAFKGHWQQLESTVTQAPAISCMSLALF